MAQKRASRKKQTVGGTILTILLVIALFLWNNPQLWEGWIPGATPEPSSPSSASTKGEPAGEAKIWYIDVGQGDSILVQLPGEDGGTGSPFAGETCYLQRETRRFIMNRRVFSSMQLPFRFSSSLRRNKKSARSRRG